jgi:hypothetical protein
VEVAEKKNQQVAVEAAKSNQELRSKREAAEITARDLETVLAESKAVNSQQRSELDEARRELEAHVQAQVDYEAAAAAREGALQAKESVLEASLAGSQQQLADVQMKLSTLHTSETTSRNVAQQAAQQALQREQVITSEKEVMQETLAKMKETLVVDLQRMQTLEGQSNELKSKLTEANETVQRLKIDMIDTQREKMELRSLNERQKQQLELQHQRHQDIDAETKKRIAGLETAVQTAEAAAQEHQTAVAVEKAKNTSLADRVAVLQDERDKEFQSYTRNSSSNSVTTAALQTRLTEQHRQHTEQTQRLQAASASESNQLQDAIEKERANGAAEVRRLKAAVVPRLKTAVDEVSQNITARYEQQLLEERVKKESLTEKVQSLELQLAQQRAGEMTLKVEATSLEQELMRAKTHLSGLQHQHTDEMSNLQQVTAQHSRKEFELQSALEREQQAVTDSKRRLQVVTQELADLAAKSDRSQRDLNVAVAEAKSEMKLEQARTAGAKSEAARAEAALSKELDAVRAEVKQSLDRANEALGLQQRDYRELQRQLAQKESEREAEQEASTTEAKRALEQAQTDVADVNQQLDSALRQAMEQKEMHELATGTQQELQTAVGKTQEESHQHERHAASLTIRNGWLLRRVESLRGSLSIHEDSAEVNEATVAKLHVQLTELQRREAQARSAERASVQDAQRTREAMAIAQKSSTESKQRQQEIQNKFRELTRQQSEEVRVLESKLAEVADEAQKAEAELADAQRQYSEQLTAEQRQSAEQLRQFQAAAADDRAQLRSLHVKITHEKEQLLLLVENEKTAAAQRQKEYESSRAAQEQHERALQGALTKAAKDEQHERGAASRKREFELEAVVENVRIALEKAQEEGRVNKKAAAHEKQELETSLTKVAKEAQEYIQAATREKREFERDLEKAEDEAREYRHAAAREKRELERALETSGEDAKEQEEAAARAHQKLEAGVARLEKEVEERNLAVRFSRWVSAVHTARKVQELQAALADAKRDEQAQIDSSISKEGELKIALAQADLRAQDQSSADALKNQLLEKALLKATNEAQEQVEAATEEKQELERHLEAARVKATKEAQEQAEAATEKMQMLERRLEAARVKAAKEAQERLQAATEEKQELERCLEAARKELKDVEEQKEAGVREFEKAAEEAQEQIQAATEETRELKKGFEKAKQEVRGHQDTAAQEKQELERALGKAGRNAQEGSDAAVRAKHDLESALIELRRETKIRMETAVSEDQQRAALQEKAAKEAHKFKEATAEEKQEFERHLEKSKEETKEAKDQREAVVREKLELERALEKAAYEHREALERVAEEVEEHKKVAAKEKNELKKDLENAAKEAEEQAEAAVREKQRQERALENAAKDAAEERAAAERKQSRLEAQLAHEENVSHEQREAIAEAHSEALQQKSQAEAEKAQSSWLSRQIAVLKAELSKESGSRALQELQGELQEIHRTGGGQALEIGKRELQIALDEERRVLADTKQAGLHEKHEMQRELKNEQRVVAETKHRLQSVEELLAQQTSLTEERTEKVLAASQQVNGLTEQLHASEFGLKELTARTERESEELQTQICDLRREHVDEILVLQRAAAEEDLQIQSTLDDTNHERQTLLETAEEEKQYLRTELQTSQAAVNQQRAKIQAQHEEHQSLEAQLITLEQSQMAEVGLMEKKCIEHVHELEVAKMDKEVLQATFDGLVQNASGDTQLLHSRIAEMQRSHSDLAAAHAAQLRVLRQETADQMAREKAHGEDERGQLQMTLDRVVEEGQSLAAAMQAELLRVDTVAKQQSQKKEAVLLKERGALRLSEGRTLTLHTALQEVQGSIEANSLHMEAQRSAQRHQALRSIAACRRRRFATMGLRRWGCNVARTAASDALRQRQGVRLSATAGHLENKTVALALRQWANTAARFGSQQRQLRAVCNQRHIKSLYCAWQLLVQATGQIKARLVNIHRLCYHRARCLMSSSFRHWHVASLTLHTTEVHKELGCRILLRAAKRSEAQRCALSWRKWARIVLAVTSVRRRVREATLTKSEKVAHQQKDAVATRVREIEGTLAKTEMEALERSHVTTRKVQELEAALAEAGIDAQKERETAAQESSKLETAMILAEEEAQQERELAREEAQTVLALAREAAQQEKEIAAREKTVLAEGLAKTREELAKALAQVRGEQKLEEELKASLTLAREEALKLEEELKASLTLAREEAQRQREAAAREKTELEVDLAREREELATVREGLAKAEGELKSGEELKTLLTLAREEAQRQRDSAAREKTELAEGLAKTREELATALAQVGGEQKLEEELKASLTLAREEALKLEEELKASSTLAREEAQRQREAATREKTALEVDLAREREELAKAQEELAATLAQAEVELELEEELRSELTLAKHQTDTAAHERAELERRGEELEAALATAQQSALSASDARATAVLNAEAVQAALVKVECELREVETRLGMERGAKTNAILRVCVAHINLAKLPMLLLAHALRRWQQQVLKGQYLEACRTNAHRALRHTLKAWLDAAQARAWRAWVAFASRQTKRKLSQQFTEMSVRKMEQIEDRLVRWKQEQSCHLVLSVVRRMDIRGLLQGWAWWRAFVRRQHEQEKVVRSRSRQMLRVINCIQSSILSAGLRAWKAMVLTLTREEARVLKSIQRMLSVTTRAHQLSASLAMRQWHGVCLLARAAAAHEELSQRAGVSQIGGVIKTWLVHNLRSAFVQWYSLLQAHRGEKHGEENRHLLAQLTDAQGAHDAHRKEWAVRATLIVLTRLCSLQLTAGWRAWRTFVQLKAHSLHLGVFAIREQQRSITRVVKRLQYLHTAMAWRSWCRMMQLLAKESRAKGSSSRMMAAVLARMERMSIVRCLNTWRRACLHERLKLQNAEAALALANTASELQVKSSALQSQTMRRLLKHLVSGQLARRFRSWGQLIERSEQSSRRAALVRRTIARVTQFDVAKSFTQWRMHTVSAASRVRGRSELQHLSRLHRMYTNISLWGLRHTGFAFRRWLAFVYRDQMRIDTCQYAGAMCLGNVLTQNFQRRLAGALRQWMLADGATACEESQQQILSSWQANLAELDHAAHVLAHEQEDRVRLIQQHEVLRRAVMLHRKSVLLTMSHAWRDWLVFIFLRHDSELQQGNIFVNYEMKLSRLASLCERLNGQQVHRAFFVLLEATQSARAAAERLALIQTWEEQRVEYECRYSIAKERSAAWRMLCWLRRQIGIVLSRSWKYWVRFVFLSHQAQGHWHTVMRRMVRVLEKQCHINEARALTNWKACLSQMSIANVMQNHAHTALLSLAAIWSQQERRELLLAVAHWRRVSSVSRLQQTQEEVANRLRTSMHRFALVVFFRATTAAHLGTALTMYYTLYSLCTAAHLGTVC